MSTMAENITVLTPSLRANACERLLISSEIYPKWKNSNTWEKFKMTFNLRASHKKCAHNKLFPT
jgi:hypothetical protein